MKILDLVRNPQILAIIALMIILELPAISADYSKIILEAANAINKKAPITVDSATTLMNAAPLTDKLLYRYKINNYEKYKTTHTLSTVRQSTMNSACTNPNLQKHFFSKGITLGYYYMDENNKYLFSFDLTPKDCGY